jgi:dTDP-4-dehydrorhamnose 3,5-epimerase
MTEGNFTFSFPWAKPSEEGAVGPVDAGGLVVIEPRAFVDARGWFQETYSESVFESFGIPKFVQDNHSFSTKGVLRGLHFQKPTWQGKLVRVTRGKVFDVAVDIRPGSMTFGAWYGIELSAEKRNMMYVPEGFAHGFLALEDSEFLYKCTNTYVPTEDGTLLYNCLNIPWLKYATDYGIEHFNLSQKDIQNAMTLDQYRYKNS